MPDDRRPRGITYLSYNFIDKDPIIDELRTLIGDPGKGALATIEHRSGVARATLYNWFHGGTKRPQHATVKAVLRALGHDLVIAGTARAATPTPTATPAAAPSPSPSPTSMPTPPSSPTRRQKYAPPLRAWRPAARRARLAGKVKRRG